MKFIRFLLVVFLSANVVALAGDEKPDGPKAAVSGYMQELINGGDWSRWDEYFTETVTFNGYEMSRDDMRKMLETFQSILSGFRMEVEEQIAEGDRVATRVTVTGKHIGDYMGLKASGQEVSFGGIAFDRFENGRIVEMWHQMDIWGTLLMATDD